jgi:hypothetical protein
MSRKYIDVRITALSDADIKDILILLRKIQWCGEAGASRNIPINVDGDGSGYYDFNLIEEKLKKVSDGDDFETTYLGE